ncbi:hypothetical protein LB505_014237, partial [Fusarium chuoi]
MMNSYLLCLLVDLTSPIGPVVRLAPKQYSFSDPSVLKQIYGIGKGVSKSSWYNASSVPHAPFKDLFTDLDDARHATNRRLVANLYSTSTLRNMEPEVEDCIKTYKQKLESLAHLGMNMNLQFWMQCYAFDVISQITLDKRFGFLDFGADKGGMFASLHEYLKYCAVLRLEIDSKYKCLGEPDFIPFNETQSMKYLQACIKEALRLHPATGLPLERVVPRGGVVLSGTYFPAGTIVGVNTWVMHRNQDVFGVDADTFMPERWLNQSKEKLSLMEASWMPFGAGSRTCIGKNISLLEINKLIPVLVRTFDFSIVNASKQRHENFWLVKQVDTQCQVQLRV